MGWLSQGFKHPCSLKLQIVLNVGFVFLSPSPYPHSLGGRDFFLSLDLHFKRFFFLLFALFFAVFVAPFFEFFLKVFVPPRHLFIGLPGCLLLSLWT